MTDAVSKPSRPLSRFDNGPDVICGGGPKDSSPFPRDGKEKDKKKRITNDGVREELMRSSKLEEILPNETLKHSSTTKPIRWKVKQTNSASSETESSSEQTRQLNPSVTPAEDIPFSGCAAPWNASLSRPGCQFATFRRIPFPSFVCSILNDADDFRVVKTVRRTSTPPLSCGCSGPLSQIVASRSLFISNDRKDC
ncbi:hypothetical protein TNIN_143461 [Trichonephila inaurata madagascariensis]|uniref:Uncharacterized protein n=1 Tax=Trichonephila inaurata madagascariensis TaxID=2747483 RepID=A0A8X6JT55_9ARAC|nr:hypothetical protein TNIN_143461 [Trichonephila inaurata madagascariensis]